MSEQRGSLNGALPALVVTVLFWSTAFPAVRASLHYYAPGQVAFLRILIGALTLAFYAGVSRMRLPRREDLPRLFLIALFGVTFYHALLNHGLVSVTSGPASMLVNMAPVFTAILASMFLNERLTLRIIAGLFVCLTGAALIGLGEGKGLRFAPGAMYLVGSALVWSINIVFQKPMLGRYSALQVAAVSLWMGVIGLSIYAPGLATAMRAAPIGVTLALVYTGIFPIGVVYATWAYVLSRMPASQAASFLYLIPFCATLFAWALLRERPSGISLVGAVVVLCGVALVNFKSKRLTDTSAAE